MSEMRRDPTKRHWVIIAPERARRPHDRRVEVRRDDTRECPFCAGNEAATPPAIRRFPADEQQPWRVRVVPNRYPALHVEGKSERQRDGLHEVWSGIGAHEVIIESPDHETQMFRLEPGAFIDTLQAYRDRLTDLAGDKRLLYGQVFKNSGHLAGASLEHVHSQLIALPILPPDVTAEMRAAERHFESSRECIYCRTISDELTTRARIVAETGRFVAFCPYASRFAFETWISPKEHAARFEGCTADDLADLATLLKRVLTAIHAVLQDTPYNYQLRTAPFRAGNTPYLHWHLQIIPRVTPVAGFEWGSGVFINPVAPEDAAAFLREHANSG